MKRILLGTAIAASALFAAPASAVIIAPGSALLPPTPGFPAGSPGTLLASSTTNSTGLTFAASVTSAVYLNASGTLDFWYQVTRTGPGTNGDQMIDGFTAGDFTGFSVDGYLVSADPDGAGAFSAENNPGAPTYTYGRSGPGAVLQVNLGANGLLGTENTATFIFHTNAFRFDANGTFGVIDGSTISGLTFQPIAGVPEPATWAMMLGGFGLLGAAMRRTRRVKAVMA